MIFSPRPLAEPAGSWDGLVAELDLWAESGREATLWWRDDDATAPTAALQRLLTLARELPLALGVIPALAEPSLFRFCEEARSVFFLQHGWRHENRAGAGEKKSEFPPSRPSAVVCSEIERGLARLRALLGRRALAVLVPPWNRLDRAFLPLLPACGVAALSGFGPARGAASSLIERNAHIDLVAWSGERGFVGEKAALGGLLAHLEARRRGEEEEVTGILTHHLVQTRETEDFLERLFAVTRAHPAARWLAAPEVFAPSAAGRR